MSSASRGRPAIPANAIGAWLGLAFVLGASARTIPTGALRGLIGLVSRGRRLLRPDRVFGEGFRAIGASARRRRSGAWSPPRRSGRSGWPGRLAARTRAGRGRSRVAMLAAALIAEGVAFGAARWPAATRSDRSRALHPRRRGCARPGPAVAAAPRGERLRGYVAVAVLAVVAAHRHRAADDRPPRHRGHVLIARRNVRA